MAKGTAKAPSTCANNLDWNAHTWVRTTSDTCHLCSQCGAMDKNVDGTWQLVPLIVKRSSRTTSPQVSLWT